MCAISFRAGTWRDSPSRKREVRSGREKLPFELREVLPGKDQVSALNYSNMTSDRLAHVLVSNIVFVVNSFVSISIHPYNRACEDI